MSLFSKGNPYLNKVVKKKYYSVGSGGFLWIWIKLVDKNNKKLPVQEKPWFSYQCCCARC